MDSEFSSCDMLESMLQYGGSGPLNLPLEYLRNITNNFSDERLLGEGGFGTVYKGMLPNGESMAVKKLNSQIPGVKDKQFENEAYHLMRLKHPNIVLLVGWCSETENIYVEYNGKYIFAEKSERLLCLEYMPKGNLRGYLSDESSGLTWETRYKIIKGICHGLHYLHEERQLNAPIIHMDLKPANILLDNNMVPKIADFGMSRLFSEEKTWTCTVSRDGTLGYMAPEYINRGLISTKSDIFSLGVIIIEIVTGKRDYPDESETGASSQEFTELVLKNWRDRMQKSVRYTSLEIDCQQIRRCIEIGLDCVKLDRWKRPTISQVIKILHGTESAGFSGRKEVISLTNEVCQQQEEGVSTSEAPFEKECQSSTNITRSNALVLKEIHLDNSFCIGRRNEKPSPTTVLTRPDVKWAAAGDTGIKGARPPPLLKLPPSMVLPVVCGAGSTWDILRSFAPDETGHQDAVDNDEEEAAVSEDIRLGESCDGFTATSSTAAESADFNGRKEVMSLTNRVCQEEEEEVSMSEALFEFEKKECQSSTMIRRSNTRARLELDRPASLALSGSAAWSLGLVNNFRIGHSGDGAGDLRLLCQTLGLSGPDDFGIPVAEWEAYKAVRLSSNTPTPALTQPDPDVKRAAAGDRKIKGAWPPPLLKPNGGFRRHKIRSWIRGALLGSGSFGTVYEGISDEGFFFAVKEVNLFDQGSNAKECVVQLEQEISLLSKFEHENIVQYYGTDKEDSKLYVFLELVTHGSLASLYRKYRLQDTHVSAYTRQILKGLTYLHKRNIVHRDIKCSNVMVHANGSVKLADFGMAKIMKFNAAKSCKGTVYWMAPEVVNPKKTYGCPADIWSLGCTVLEMLTRQIPYPDLEWTQALYRIGRGEAPSVPSGLSKDARDLISQCLRPNPEDRPSASELLEHPFINMSMASPIQ